MHTDAVVVVLQLSLITPSIQAPSPQPPPSASSSSPPSRSYWRKASSWRSYLGFLGCGVLASGYWPACSSHRHRGTTNYSLGAYVHMAAPDAPRDLQGCLGPKGLMLMRGGLLLSAAQIIKSSWQFDALALELLLCHSASVAATWLRSNLNNCRESQQPQSSCSVAWWGRQEVCTCCLSLWF